MSIALAVTCHDPAGGFAPGVRDAATALRASFETVAVNATDQTAPATIEALQTEAPDLRLATHAAGSIGIGTARREALALALGSDCSHVLYSDLDHILRWATIDPGELRDTLARAGEVDLVVVGRAPDAFAKEPARLRATEPAVNQAASLALALSGQEVWDFMIAIRLMTRRTAQLLVDECDETTIANDVAWPLHAHSRGLSLAHHPVRGLAYRFRDDFGSDRDDRDSDPMEWVRRLEIAARHATAIRPYLPGVVA